MKCKIKKGDMVAVIAGRDKGAHGLVSRFDREKNRLFVEGVGGVVRHTKPSEQNPEGGIVRKEMSIHVSNVMLVDPSQRQNISQGWTRKSLTRIGFRKDDQGEKIRYAKRSGETLGKVR